MWNLFRKKKQPKPIAAIAIKRRRVKPKAATTDRALELVDMAIVANEKATKAIATKGMKPYQITNSIPAPFRHPRVSKDHSKNYPFAKMKVGDSFFTPLVSPDISHWQRYHNIRLKSQPDILNGVLGTRIWRIK
jgi:hypothetical protein